VKINVVVRKIFKLCLIYRYTMISMSLTFLNVSAFYIMSVLNYLALSIGVSNIRPCA